MTKNTGNVGNVESILILSCEYQEISKNEKKTGVAYSPIQSSLLPIIQK